MRTVSQVAALAGVTVRTLHHYDQIGLLEPSGRSPSGYRLYDHADLQRLQQILLWRQLGFSLADIAALLDDPQFDHRQALYDQRAALVERLDGMTRTLKAIDEMITEAEGGPTADEEEMFMGFDHTAHEAEAEERWGDTEPWRQSRARAARWTPQDRARMEEESLAFARRLADAYTAGVAADSEAAMDLAEQARLQIQADHYDCPREMHVNLGEMYVADPRFTRHYDQHAEGLAVWFRDAIAANAARPVP